MLPEGWKKVPLHEIAEIRTGLAKGKTDLKDPVELPYLRVANVQDGRVDLREVKTILVERANIERYALQDGDILMTEGGDFDKLGRGDVWHGQIPLCLHQNHVFAVRPDPDKLDSNFLAALAASEHGRNYFLSCAKRSTNLASINASQLKALPILMPSLLEQERIASILSAWEEAIFKTEKLLANCKKQKVVLLSQLLSGKKRLRVFSRITSRQATPHGSIPADWRYVKVEAVASEVSLKNAALMAAPVLSCTKHAGLVDSLDYFKKQVFSKDLSTYKVVPRNCFVYATNHIEEGSIGHQDLYDAGLVSPMYTVFKTTADVDDRYLYRLLKTEHFRQIFQAATNSSVDRRGSLRWKDFKKLHLPLPPLKEQAAIASIVDAMDREIELLQKQLEALKAEKIALMQQLLTGKCRVTLSAAAAKPSPTKAKSTKPNAVKDRRK